MTPLDVTVTNFAFDLNSLIVFAPEYETPDLTPSSKSLRVFNKDPL